MVSHRIIAFDEFWIREIVIILRVSDVQKIGENEVRKTENEMG